jgi:hypothetical protein
MLHIYVVVTHLYKLDHFFSVVVLVVVSRVDVHMLVIAVLLVLVVAVLVLLLVPSSAPISQTLIVLSALHVTIAPGGSTPYSIHIYIQL